VVAVVDTSTNWLGGLSCKVRVFIRPLFSSNLISMVRLNPPYVVEYENASATFLLDFGDKLASNGIERVRKVSRNENFTTTAQTLIEEYERYDITLIICDLVLIFPAAGWVKPQTTSWRPRLVLGMEKWYVATGSCRSGHSFPLELFSIL
jgi:hypothetical protein